MNLYSVVATFAALAGWLAVGYALDGWRRSLAILKRRQELGGCMRCGRTCPVCQALGPAGRLDRAEEGEVGRRVADAIGAEARKRNGKVAP